MQINKERFFYYIADEVTSYFLICIWIYQTFLQTYWNILYSFIRFALMLSSCSYYKVIRFQTQMAIPYMLIFATFERFMWINGGDNKRISCLNYIFSATGRRITIALILLISIVLRLPMVWAYRIQTYPNCSDFFRSLEVGPTDLFYEVSFRFFSILFLHYSLFSNQLLLNNWINRWIKGK